MIFDTISMAIKSILSNKLRSGLTMLGVVIGIASVIILVAIGEAAKQYVVAQMQSFGMKTTLLQIMPGKDQGDFAAFLNNKMRVKHADNIKQFCPSVDEVVPIIVGKGKAKYGKEEYDVNQIWGTTDNYQRIYSHKVVNGRFFSKGDVDGARKVCVVGSKIVKELFGGIDPINEKIKISGKKFLIIGVFEEKGKILVQDFDDVIAMPISTSSTLFDTKGVVEIDVLAKSDLLMPKAIKEINEIVGKDLDKGDFHIETQEGMMKMLGNIIGLLTAVVGGIAAISLLVGSIGIMNIMLVSVTERTREIGIRKAIGAKKIDVFFQFLIESIVISFLGGLLGILLGLSGTFALMFIFKMGMVVVAWAITLAFTVSLFIGILSGVYPAMRAVNLDPIEALRYE